VCQWPAHACVAAGTDPQGSDGWCNVDAECKCLAQGATCDTTTFHCTVTLAMSSAPPPDLSASVPMDMAVAVADAAVAVDAGIPRASSGCSTSASTHDASLLSLAWLAVWMIRRRFASRALMP
jgi:hypothetical protein